MVYKTELEKSWTEQVFPLIKEFEDKCNKLGIVYKWECVISDEIFGGETNASWRKPKNKKVILQLLYMVNKKAWHIYDDTENCTLEELLQEGKKLLKQENVDVMLIDPDNWNDNTYNDLLYV